MSDAHKTQLSFSSYRDDAVIIGVFDSDAKGCMIDAADKKLQDQIHRHPYKWSDVKASLIAANIFSTSIIDGLETDLRTIKVASAFTDVSRSTISTLISNLPKAQTR
jgi:hypothetical protein